VSIGQSCPAGPQKSRRRYDASDEGARTIADHQIVGKVAQASPFCPNIAATPDSKQVWFTLKDTGKTQVFDGQPPFSLLKTLDTGPITNHVNIVRNANGMFAYVTVGGLNEIQAFRTDDFSKTSKLRGVRLGWCDRQSRRHQCRHRRRQHDVWCEHGKLFRASASGRRHRQR
jgi:hypothetical protein